MKRWLAVAINIVLMMVLVVPGAATPKSNEGEGVIIFIDYDDNVPYWNDLGEDNLEVDDQAQNTIVWEGTYGPNVNDRFDGALALSLECEGEECSIEQDLYIDMEISVTWTSNYDCPIDVLYGNFRGYAEGASLHAYYGGCDGTLRGGTCALHISGVIPAEEIVDQTEDEDIFLGFGITNVYSLAGYTPIWTWTITVSTSPILGDCDNYASAGIVASGNINPTSETGSTALLTVGQKYRLNIFGGPWNDGAHDRFDAAYRQDNGPWTSLAASEEKLCSSSDESTESIVFAATSTAFAVRVNDFAGWFANNTGALSYSLELVFLQIAPGNCSSQYLTGQRIASGVLDPKSSTGSHVSIIPKEGGVLFIGSWISIVLSGGPWYNNGTGAGRYDAQIKMAPGNTWAELSASGETGCVDLNLNYLTAYIQITNNTSIYLRVNDDGTWTANTGSLNYAIYTTTYSPLPQGGCASTYQIGSLIQNVTVSASSSNGVEFAQGYVQEDNLKEEGGISKKYLAIETSGVWYNSGTLSVGGAIVEDPNTTVSHSTWNWSSLPAFPYATCVVRLDPIGHYRIYIPYDKEASYWFRVADTAFGDNTGALDFIVHEATNRKEEGYNPGDDMPDPGVCDDEYSHGTGVTITLSAKNSSGYLLGIAKENYGLFAIATSGGPWSDNGNPSYEVAISDDDGTTWSKLQAYESSLCAQSDDGDHILLYAQYLSGRRFKVRVYDTDGNFSYNSGSINVIYYQDVTTTIEPWTTCSDDYGLTTLSLTDELRTVPAQQSVGFRVSSLVPGKTYALEFDNGYYWREPAALTENRYDARISVDEGYTWFYFGPGKEGGAGNMALCISLLNSATLPLYQQRFRIYFVAPSSIRLRVNDTNASFMDNLGYLKYTLYGAEDKENPPPNPKEYPPGLPPDWGSACYEDYLRPTGFFKDVTIDIPEIPLEDLWPGKSLFFPSFTVPVPAIDDWIEYLSWALRNYFAWCPEHTEALKHLFSNLVATKEPLATFDALSSFITDTKSDFDSYNFGDKEGGESPLSTGISGGETGKECLCKEGLCTDKEGRLCIPDKENPPPPSDLMQFLTSGFDKEQSPWFGGEINLNYTASRGGESTKEEIDTAVAFCASHYSGFFGDQAAESTCKTLITLNDTPIFQTFVLIIDFLLVLFTVVKYIPNWFKRMFKLIVGNKKAVGAFME